MSLDLVEKVGNALLYEGYMLYPYRPSSVKNRQRFNFGVVYPERSDAGGSEDSDPHFTRTECLIEGDARTAIDVKVRFLQLTQRTVGRLTDDAVNAGRAGIGDYVAADTLRVDHRILQPWQEAVERAVIVPSIPLGGLTGSARKVRFRFEAAESIEPVSDAGGSPVGVIARRQLNIAGEVEVSAIDAAPGLFRIRVEIRNRSSSDATHTGNRDELLLNSLVSTHTILRVSDGAFVSLLDPPESLREIAATCRGIGSWPVLIGEEGQRDTMLSSPIIIYDYPMVAPESPGDLFDSTEIDEILSLRVLTMTDSEKSEMRQVDERARLLLERTESLSAEDMMRMHGTMRELRPARAESA